jgi:hypothetical protein
VPETDGDEVAGAATERTNGGGMTGRYAHFAIACRARSALHARHRPVRDKLRMQPLEQFYHSDPRFGFPEARTFRCCALLP